MVTSTVVKIDSTLFAMVTSTAVVNATDSTLFAMVTSLTQYTASVQLL